MHERQKLKIHFDPQVHNFPLKKASTRAERDVYEVHWNLKLVCRGANVEVQWQILRDRLFDSEYLRLNGYSTSYCVGLLTMEYRGYW